MRIHRIQIVLLTVTLAAAAHGASPIFENRTPIGFSPQDSTTRSDFIVGEQVSVRVDLNQAATEDHPVYGHFHSLERAVQVDGTDTDGMQVDIAMVDVVPFGTNANLPAPGVTQASTTPVIHMAWIEEVGTSLGRPPFNGGITPVYQVMYSRSFDAGKTFSTSVSVSNTLRFHPLSFAVSGGVSYSTLDLEVDSGGNPRVVYAFVSTADRRRNKNVYFSYSSDGGSNWFPTDAQGPIEVNDFDTVLNIEGKTSAFPRMAIDDRDNIFITYVRGASTGGGTDDVMLAKVNRYTTPFSVLPVGQSGIAGTGGVRITPEANRETGPDIAIGDGDALHVLYFNDSGDQIEHRRSLADTNWINVGTTGWNQTAVGATVSAFVDETTGNTAVETDARYYFPTLAIDRNRLPDRVYSVFKFGDSTPDEGVYFNQYDDDGTVGTGITWGTAASVFSSGVTSVFDDGNLAYNIELDWELTERVAAVVDDRLEDKGDLHIAFTAGYSSGNEHDIYYAFYNGNSWTLPEKVADDDSDAGTEDGIAATDVFLLSPALTEHPDLKQIYMAFAGGTAEGFGLGNVTNVNHHSYFKVLGRSTTHEDVSIPVGAYQYTLSYTPVNQQTVAAEITNNPVYVHVADPTDGSSLGALDSNTDGFLAGSWESVATTLADDDKFFEGLINEDATSTNEWGDDDDKISLLAKLNVLGSDSSTNIQVITNSTASNAGTGLGARTVRVGADPTGAFVTAGSYFILGARIDIVPTNSGPAVSITEPNGTGDVANNSFDIQYGLTDSDDDFSGNLKGALYFYGSGDLKSVRDVRIFATLIVDQRDVTGTTASNDFLEGSGQTYTWDDPSLALKDSLFASIQRTQSGDYYIYLVADDGKNPPVFAVSPGAVSVKHSPIVQQIDPIVADTVDTGVRTGIKANPYDLDFTIADFDTEARIQLFYADVSGITSVSVSGVYPNQKFSLGKSVSGTRGTAITDSTSLTTRNTEFSWDVTSPLVAQGGYFIYAVATDSTDVVVGNSAQQLVVRHSPSFTFYEPPKDTQRDIDSGSQPIYTIQWQKGPGDKDLDEDATVDLYFTTDDPAVTDHSTASGADTTSLTGDADTKLIVSGLTENLDGAGDMYAWNLRTPPNDIPISARRVWLYAKTTDGSGNVSVSRGGSLTITHNPYVILNTRFGDVSQGDVVRLEWDDYMVDDQSGTDDAYIRLYASRTSGLTSLQTLEANLLGSGGNDDTFLINSSDGTTSGTITSIREDSSNAFNWDTRSSGLTVSTATYTIYAGISADATFADNTTGRVSEGSNQLTVGVGSSATSNLSLAPTKFQASVGDTVTFEVLVSSGGISADAVSAIVDLGSTKFSVVNPTSPFTDIGEVFSGGTVFEDTTIGTAVRYTKSKAGGEVVGTDLDPSRLASFQVIVDSSFAAAQQVKFDENEASLSLVGSPVALTKSNGLSTRNAQLQNISRGQIKAEVLIEGRSAPVGNGDHTSFLDVHLRLPGNTLDISDARFKTANDDFVATADTVEVKSSSSGALTLVIVPPGRYVLTVKDTSHLSGRSDTLTVRNGEMVTMSSALGFFSSDIRGDASFLLDQDGRELKAGDVTEDNEIDEDDVNAIDAAWGANATATNFAQADLNNDGRVGVEDLTVTTSNISNSTGFGAPPVFKIPVAASNGAAGLEILAPHFDDEWRHGREVELVFAVKSLQDLAGYAFDLSYDPLEVELLEQFDLGIGEIFAPNPDGYFKRLEQEDGRLSVAAARRGKRWSAAGDGELMRIRVRLFTNGFPSSLELRNGQFMSSSYESTEIRFLSDPRTLAVPKSFTLGQNYPNPFNPSTTIPFNVPAFNVVAGLVPVQIDIFNVAGQKVKTVVDDFMQPGYYNAAWDGRNNRGHSVATGIYLYRVRVQDMSLVRKMTLVK
jgi:hypothetical protein